MKKILFVLTSIILFLGTSCKEKIDVEKENEAIKAVFEADKVAYFNQDYVAMGNLWVKDESSVKIFMSSTGITKFDGWNNIDAGQKKETEDTSWDRKKVNLNFLNFKINLLDSQNASIVCEAAWDGIMGSDTINAKQSRVIVMKKVDDIWKYNILSIYNIPEK